MEGTRTCLVTSRLLKQGFDFTRLQNTFRKFLQQDPIALCKYQVSRKTCMFNVFLVHCLFFLLCVVTSLPVKCYHTHIHVHATSVQVLSCCVVFCLHVVCSLNVHYPCHAYHYSWSSLYITCTTVPVLCTCYICPHIPCYMSALLSTCYLSVSTIQHIQYWSETRYNANTLCTCLSPEAKRIYLM